ncbi:Ig-like domain-containing protein [Flavonifractor sp. An100]|uniref:Ig-like domain-containing protein n=1 Tax=Flavonifractor sp. An100 TaxID=1965538 RepID=UPI000B394DE4|nr:Ig-like domain-containing protein [Flavonifractor sp. An100]OUQ82272.1 hypothetical protein B5E43_00385 [Flavonifractor sp. An100]
MAKMRTRLKKLLAVMLAVSMTMSLLNLTAFATDGSDPLTVEVGQTLDLSGRDDGSTSTEPVTDPDEATDESWRSSDPQIASVDPAGTVTGVYQGEAVITHTSYFYLWTNPDDESQQDPYDFDEVDDPDENMTLQRTVTTWEIQVPGPAAEVGDTAYDTLDEAVEKAPEGSTIVLLRDCTTKGINLKKDLTIKSEDGQKYTITFTDNGIALWGKSLTFEECDVVLEGIGSTPYTAEWNWMTICASKDASLTLNNATMSLDGTGAGNVHAIYFCSNNQLNLDYSTLIIKNYKQDALEWDGGDGGYNVNITNSTYISDNNRSGFTGTFYATIKNSNVEVINSAGNGSNGSHFIIEDSTVDFSGNGSRGLSAGLLHIKNSTVTANSNNGMGITVNNELQITDNSTVTVMDNASNSSYGYAAVRLYNDYACLVDATSKLYIKDNHNTGLYVRQGSLTVEEGATLEITGNQVGNSLLDGYGGGLYVGYGANYDPTVVLPSDAAIYNNHSSVGGDDIYVSEGVEGPTLTFGATDSEWVLDDCNHAIDGWYQDGPDNRWAAHKKPLHTEEFTGYTASPVVGPLALKAAHGLIPLEPDDPDLPDWDISKSKKATNLDEDYQSQVTLSLPAASYSQALDVVFVLDGSTSTDEDDLATAASQLLGELAGFENLNTKAGLVIFGGSEPVLYSSGSLLSLEDPANLAALQTEMTDSSYDGMDGRSGSNLQAGVEAARAMLGADRSVSAEDKYMILLTDCAARMWYEDGAAMAQAYWCNDRVYWNSNCDFVDFRYPGNTPCPSFSDTWADAQMGITIGAYGMTEAEKNAASQSDVASTDTVINDPGYYTTYEAAAYYAATSLTEAANEAHLVLVSYPYHNETNFGQYIESFRAWLDDEGYVTRYDSGSLSTEKIFDNVKDELIQLVDTGSKVVDVIGSGVDNAGNDYNFDFVNQADKLSLTVGGTALAVTTIDENTYGFGTAKDGVYPFLLRYYAKGEDGSSQECFVWEINQPVTKTAPVQLTYSVVLTNPQSTSGTYGVYDEYGTNHETSLLTNLEATLYPVDSTGAAGVPENFAKPTVSYTVETSGGGGGGGTTTSYDLIVRYLEEGTEKVLATAYSTTKVSGSSYDVTDRTEKEIDGYVQTDITGDPVKGTMNSDKEIIVWYVSEEDIEEPETPTTETPENPEDPKDPGTELPDGETPTSELPEEEVPKADVPATGDPSLIWLAASALSGSGLAWLALSERKGKRED